MLNVSLIFYLPENEFLMHVHLLFLNSENVMKNVAKEKYIRQFFFFFKQKIKLCRFYKYLQLFPNF